MKDLEDLTMVCSQRMNSEKLGELIFDLYHIFSPSNLVVKQIPMVDDSKERVYEVYIPTRDYNLRLGDY